MTEPYIPYTNSTSSSTGLLASLLVPQQTAPASSTRVVPPSAYNRLLSLPKQETKIDSLLQSIQNIDDLSLVPKWRADWKMKRALEVSQVLRDYGKYNGLVWDATSGVANPYMKFMTQWKYPSYQNNFSPSGQFKSLEFSDSSIVVDLPHFNASLSRYLDCYSDDCALPTEWASWAGDMFTYAAHLDSLRTKNSLSYAAVLDSAKKHIGGNDSQYSKFFGTGDFYADIDARNIASLINNKNLSLYDAIDRYYKQKEFGRFITFVNSYGGWKKFAEKVNKHYFFPLTVKLNPYLLEISKRAFMNKVLKGLLNEIGLD
ncbi:MAG: hypothetical protein IJ896_07575 [Fibrobacter sp.]|nr:hypothetical protein [Fibrobacter sp.]